MQDDFESVTPLICSGRRSFAIDVTMVHEGERVACLLKRLGALCAATTATNISAAPHNLSAQMPLGEVSLMDDHIAPGKFMLFDMQVAKASSCETAWISR